MGIREKIFMISSILAIITTVIGTSTTDNKSLQKLLISTVCVFISLMIISLIWFIIQM